MRYLADGDRERSMESEMVGGAGGGGARPARSRWEPLLALDCGVFRGCCLWFLVAFVSKMGVSKMSKGAGYRLLGGVGGWRSNPRTALTRYQIN